MSKGKASMVPGEEHPEDESMDLGRPWSDNEDDRDADDVEEQVDKFFAELDLDQERQKKRIRSQGVKVYRRRSMLPSHLHDVMGSANLSLARGDTDAAIKLCNEVIRQAPHVVEPFLTLATVYEDKGEMEKLVQILLIAAHLKRSDLELWVKVAGLAAKTGNLELAAKCYSNATHLDPRNLALQSRKANIYHELGMHKKAIDSYETVLKNLPPDHGKDFIEVSKELARFYHSNGDDAMATSKMQDAHQKYPFLFDNEAVNILTELLIASKSFQEAFQLLSDTFQLSPASGLGMSESPAPEEPFSLSAAITMSIGEESFDPVLEELTKSTPPVTFRGCGEEQEQAISTIEIPTAMPVDLRAKLVVCAIHLRKALPENVLDPFSSSPGDYGDLLLDIADAYTENEEHSKALPLLSSLIHTESFNQAGVWLKHAECLHALNELEQAAMSYAQVLCLAPQHTQTRLTLAVLYSLLGMTEDALAVIDEESFSSLSEEIPVLMEEQVTQPHRGPLSVQGSVPVQPQGGIFAPTTTQQLPKLSQDVRLLLTKFNLLLSEGRDKEYVEVGKEMLVFLFFKYYHIPNISDILRMATKNKRALMRKLGDGETDMLSASDVKFLKEQESHVSSEEWWKIFVATCKALYKHGRHSELLRLVVCANAAKKFESSSSKQGFQLLAASACFLLKEYHLAFLFLRFLYLKMDFTHPILWNTMNKIPCAPRIQKFAVRLLVRKKNTIFPLMMILANYCLGTSSYKFALGLYEILYRELPDDYLVCLCIAVSYANLAVQKFSLHKNTLAIQSIAFLHKYARLRGKCHEMYYNVGRLFHQFGVVHIAVYYYKQALALEPEVGCSFLTGSSRNELIMQQADLRKEVAHNLSLIYKATNPALALHYLRRYCTI